MIFGTLFRSKPQAGEGERRFTGAAAGQAAHGRCCTEAGGCAFRWVCQVDAGGVRGQRHAWYICLVQNWKERQVSGACIVATLIGERCVANPRTTALRHAMTLINLIIIHRALSYIPQFLSKGNST